MEDKKPKPDEKPISATAGNALANKAKAKLGTATKGLGAKRKHKKIHMSIEPTDNDGYITKQHSEGGEKPMDPSQDSDRPQTHAHPDLKALLAHIQGQYGGGDQDQQQPPPDPQQAQAAPPAASPAPAMGV
jgi:hypothetical protein